MDGVGEVASLLEDYDQVLGLGPTQMQILKSLDLCKLRLKEKLRLRELGPSTDGGDSYGCP